VFAHRKNMLVSFVMILGAVGCVSQEHADNMQTLYRQSQEQIVDLNARLEEKQAEVDALASNQAGADSGGLEQVTAERDELSQTLAQVEAQLRALKVGPILEPELNQALVELAEAHPDLISFEPKFGMVKFRSDLTFDLGSTDVGEDAQAILQQLGAILSTPEAETYLVAIVGHTDNVPIGRPTTRAQHPTNWHLSVHRAIAVKDILVSASVPTDRICVAGFGEHRPIAKNGLDGNEENRRVEVFLVRQGQGLTALTGIPSVAPSVEDNETAAVEVDSWSDEPSAPQVDLEATDLEAPQADELIKGDDASTEPAADDTTEEVWK